MTEKTVEWNLAFSHAETVERVAGLLTRHGYGYSRTDVGTEVCFQVQLAQGGLSAVARPLPSRPSPFSPDIILHRTLLVMTYTGVSAEQEDAFRHQLTLAFLRVGG